MKKNTLKNINEMKKFANRMPKTINEALQFEGDEEFGMEDDMQEGMPEEAPMNNSGIGDDKINNFIKATRKNALEIMTATNDDETKARIYEVAKKIWQICEKELNDDKQQQEGNMQNQNNANY